MQKRYPFKFLDAYTRDDSDFFFGRNDEIDALYEMVFQTDLLLVYGASGTGKTSLIQCGLASKFQSHDWLALNIRRGGDLNASFEKALQDAGGVPSEGGTSSDPLTSAGLDWLDEDWDSDGPTPTAAKNLSPLARRFKAIYLKHFKPLYLIFDQFEELYILGKKDEQDKFIQTVKEILLVEQPVKIIFSIREEYLGYLYEFERAVPELLRKKLRVEPMNLDKVKTVIKSIGGQKQGNVRLQPGEEDAIAGGIFDKIRGEEKTLSIQLPYLQVFLDKLYLQTTGDKKRQADAVFTHAELGKMGDIGDVLRNFLDEQVLLTAQKLGQQPESIWRILSPFVTLDGTKEPLSELQLCERLPAVDAPLIGSTLQAFVNSRILRYTEHEQLYEIAHDSLAKQIHAKRSDEEIAILEVQRLIKSQVALQEEAREYFTEKQLLFIEPYLSKFKPSEAEQEWVDKSRAFRQKERDAEGRRQAEELKKTKQRLRLVRGLLGAAVLALLIAGYSISQANQAKKSANESAQKAKTEEQKAKDALAQVEIEKDSTEEQRKKADNNFKLAEAKTKEAETNSQLAQDNLKKAKAEEAKAKAALLQVEKEKEATEEQRIIAENNLKVANDNAFQAEAEEEKAKDALQKMREANAIIVRSQLKEADRKILSLDYEAALQQITNAGRLDVAHEDMAASYMEIAFWYNEAGNLTLAASLADSVAYWLDYYQAPPQIRQANFNDTIQVRGLIRAALFQLDSAQYNLMRKRYYPDMVKIKGGPFTMGCDSLIDPNCQDDETRHEAVLSDYAIARTETTVWQFALYCAATPGLDINDFLESSWSDPGNNPVVNVSWYQAAEYANWVSRQWGEKEAISKDGNGKYSVDLRAGYRLPTEAEWEYAAKGGNRPDGTIYSGDDDLDAVGWFSENNQLNGISRAHPVGGKKKNALGLYDMSGNVWEWCWDWYDRNYYKDGQQNPHGPDVGGNRVLRGGSWYYDAVLCRTSLRNWFLPALRFNYYGFRLVSSP